MIDCRLGKDVKCLELMNFFRYLIDLSSGAFKQLINIITERYKLHDAHTRIIENESKINRNPKF